MKWNRNNTIAFIGFALLSLLVLGGLIVGAFFLFPEMEIWGITAVNQRNTQVVYRDADVIKEIFSSRRLIIESQTADINILMGKEHKMAEGTIVVEENASGLSFNSIDRTHIEWMQELVTENETQTLYYKIKVLEPAGIISRGAPTTVFINLWRDSVAPAGTSIAPYDIILRTGGSVVKFGGDDVNPDGNVDSDSFHINTLKIESARHVKFPIIYNPIKRDFYVDVNNVIVTGNGITLDCGGTVHNEVKISGSNGTYNFMGIRETVNYGSNALTITGSGNNVKATGNVGGNVSFKSPSGNLKLFKNSGSIDVETNNATISLGSVKGNDGVKMKTVSGPLSASSIDEGGVIFNATGSANIDVGYSEGAVKIEKIGSGSVRIGGSGGSVDIPKMGTNAINLGNGKGIGGNVTINSEEVNGGKVYVRFNDIASTKTATIKGFDGNVEVLNIRGSVDISLRSSGRGNIHAHFLAVVGVSSLTTVGYVNDKNTVSVNANITVKIRKEINPFTLSVTGSSYAWDARKNDYIFNSTEQSGSLVVEGGNNEGWGGGGGSSSNRINATLPARFTLTY